MPVKLLISFLAKDDIAINLRIALLIIDRTSYKMYSFLLKQIFFIKPILQEVIHCFIKLYRGWIFKFCFVFESYAINPFATLWYAIILCIKYLKVYVIATIFLESFLYDIPCTPLIMTQHSLNIFKDENLRLTFNNNTSKFTK